MVNPTAPTVPIELGGKTRNMLLDFNALAQFEEATGLNMFTGFARDSLDARKTRTLIWCALLHEDPEVTEQDVGQWLTLNRTPEIMGLVTRLFEVSMPEPEEAPPVPLAQSRRRPSAG